MMLEIHMKMYVADSDFLEYFFPKSLGRWAKNRFFEFIDKILSSLFAESALQWKLLLFAVLLHKAFIWQKCSQPIRLQDF